MSHPSEQLLRALGREQLGARGAASEQVSTQGEEALQLGGVGTEALRHQVGATHAGRAHRKHQRRLTVGVEGVCARARLEQGTPGVHRAAERGEVQRRHAVALGGLEARRPAGRAPEMRLDGRGVVLDRVRDDRVELGDARAEGVDRRVVRLHVGVVVASRLVLCVLTQQLLVLVLAEALVVRHVHSSGGWRPVYAMVRRLGSPAPVLASATGTNAGRNHGRNFLGCYSVTTPHES